MKVIGLTGGIGCGKSTVGRMLAERGLPIVDADQIARDVVAAGTPGLAAIAARFGAGVLQADGALDRAALGRLVFAHEDERRALEAITHPAIAAETGRRLATLARSGVPLAIYEAPLLFEAKREGSVHAVVAVIAREDVQLQRIAQRGGTTEQDAQARMAAQLPNAHKASRADFTIDNSGDIDALRRQVDSLVEQWRARGWLEANSPPTITPNKPTEDAP